MRVLIIGAGSAGLLMAHVFKKAGIEATVFEQDASPTTRSRDWSFGVYWAQSPLVDCLPPDLAARLPTVQTDLIFKPHKDEVLPIHHGGTGELLRSVEAPYAVRYRRKAFLKLLSEGVNIRFGKVLAGISVTATGVTATFTDGTKESGTMLIGADGAHSAVRNFLFQSSPQDAELLDTPIVASETVAKFDDADVALALREIHPLAYITINPNGVFSFASTQDCSATDPADWTFAVIMTWRSDENLSAAPKSHQEIHDDMIRHSQDLTWPFKEAATALRSGSVPFWQGRMTYWPTKPWDGYGGRVTLAGDAAHAMTFHRGQGLGNAIADAAVLQQYLQAMNGHTSEELAKAVRAYEAEMWPRGYGAVMGNLENTLALHDWDTVMKSPIVTGGIKRETDEAHMSVSGYRG
ncbi:hypothetical protein B0T18DRAFT_439943 [Schizothecium vesticola]|uniref:FAD-binding domain-containing protein n=1 Tax=Schizothecium vesticola TaxID=314040 RepID=A0AA40EIW3_9PEZI|nr:hypothetical protein B0T18DRAFT_439943 [Schizothecium vesticola]